jgi:hypothetical protein
MLMQRSSSGESKNWFKAWKKREGNFLLFLVTFYLCVYFPKRTFQMFAGLFRFTGWVYFFFSWIFWTRWIIVHTIFVPSLFPTGEEILFLTTQSNPILTKHKIVLTSDSHFL